MYFNMIPHQCTIRFRLHDSEIRLNQVFLKILASTSQSAGIGAAKTNMDSCCVLFSLPQKVFVIKTYYRNAESLDCVIEALSRRHNIQISTPGKYMIRRLPSTS